MSSAEAKLDQLTSTRFIAALSVLFYHGGPGLLLLSLFPINPLLTSGNTAVSYFYVLSGFVMALAYIRPGKTFDLKTYAVARFSRIYPVYVLAFVVTCVYYLDQIAQLGGNKIWANLLLYQAWIPRYSQSYNAAAWSLSVEAFFYLIFPLLVYFALRQPAKRLIVFSIIFWAFSQIVHSSMYIALMPDARLFLSFFPLLHLNAFLLGVAGGVWYVREAPLRTVKPGVNLAWLLVGLGLISAALSARRYAPDLVGNFSLDIGLLAPFFLIVILTLALDTSRIARALSHPWLVLLGDASYALYILHSPIRWLIERALELTGSSLSYAAMYSLYAPGVIILSVIVFLRIERPARDWLRKNIDRLPLMLLDLALIAAAVYAVFGARLGSAVGQMSAARTFTLRVGLTAFFLGLVVTRSYGKASWRLLALAAALGAAALTALMYLAYRQGWVEGFPLSILLPLPVVIFALLYGYRLAVRRWRPALLA